MSLILQYFNEKRKWLKFGKPIRSQSEKDRIYRICEGCEFFKKKNSISGNCDICGCNIKRYGNFLNKIAWGTTRCPLQEPKWIEDKEEYIIDIEPINTTIQQEQNNEMNIKEKKIEKACCK